jgi:hypothetical protein
MKIQPLGETRLQTPDQVAAACLRIKKEMTTSEIVAQMAQQGQPHLGTLLDIRA